MELSAKEMGELADEFRALQDQRYAADKVAAALKKQETEAYDRLVGALLEADLTTIGGKTCAVSIDMKRVFNIESDEELRAHVIETGNIDVFQRRLSEAYLKERYANDDPVPGVKVDQIAKLSVHRINS